MKTPTLNFKYFLLIIIHLFYESKLMKTTNGIKSLSRSKQLSVRVLAAASLTALLPTDALAGCRRIDVACQLKEAANRARDAARRATDEVRRKADEARAQTEAAARRAEEEARRQADAAKAAEEAAAREAQRVKDIADEARAHTEAAARFAEDEARRQADAAKAAGEAATREAQRLKDIAEAEIIRLAQQVMQNTLDTAFGQLRGLGLNVLADAKNFTNPDLWLREITLAVMKDLGGQEIVDVGTESVSYIQNQLGTFSESAPFGNGPVGRQLQNEVEKTYKKALQNATQAGEKAIDYLNPHKNPLVVESSDFNIAKDMYGFDMPSFMRFGYGTSFQVKPLDVAIDGEKRFPGVLKGTLQTTFPLLWGDNNGASTVFVNAVNDKKFKFQVGISAGVGSKKLSRSDDLKGSAQSLINFDVTCSTVVIGKCQLTKISYKDKLEVQRKSNEEFTGDVKKAVGSMLMATGHLQRSSEQFARNLKNAMASMLMATDYLQTFAVLSKGDRERLDAVLRHVSSTIDQPLAMIDMVENFMSVPQDVAEEALSRQADVGAIAYIFAALSAIDLPSKKWQDDNWKKSTTNYKSAFTISDIEALDLSKLYEWHNADSVNNVFKPGFTFIGGTNPLPDVIGYEITKKIGTEAKFKLGNPDGVTVKANESEIGISANVNTAASIAMVLPLKTYVMNNLSALYDPIRTSPMTSELSNLIASDKTSFSDRIGLGASKQWSNPAELAELEGALQMTDKLNHATHIAISEN